MEIDFEVDGARVVIFSKGIGLKRLWFTEIDGFTFGTDDGWRLTGFDYALGHVAEQLDTPEQDLWDAIGESGSFENDEDQ